MLLVFAMISSLLLHLWDKYRDDGNDDNDDNDDSDDSDWYLDNLVIFIILVITNTIIILNITNDKVTYIITLVLLVYISQ